MKAELLQSKDSVLCKYGSLVVDDPYAYNDGSNLYQFVGSNPVNFVDPLGLQATTQPSNPPATTQSSSVTGGVLAELGKLDPELLKMLKDGKVTLGQYDTIKETYPDGTTESNEARGNTTTDGKHVRIKRGMDKVNAVAILRHELSHARNRQAGTENSGDEELNLKKQEIEDTLAGGGTPPAGEAKTVVNGKVDIEKLKERFSRGMGTAMKKRQEHGGAPERTFLGDEDIDLEDLIP